ncbi:hypothetical protein JXD38_04875 [candidate division WOR-3 bacterium]|nr:hypothetical protein [candidate division WOR-3 bacterium]
MKRYKYGVVVLVLVAAVGTTVANWTDDFESYPAGQWPSPDWISSGNSDGYIVTDVKHGGEKSFRMYGVLGAYWGALAHRYIGTDAAYTIDFWIRNGDEPIPPSGHQYRGSIDLHTQANWVPPAARIMDWDKYGQVHGRGGTLLGSYNTLTWYHVEVLYERNATAVHMEYWIDGVYKGEENLAASSSELDFDYIALTAQAGTVWYDDVSVTTPAVDATVDFDPDMLNLKSRGSWVTCYVELPCGYSVRDVELATVAISQINGQPLVPPLYREGPTGIGDYDHDEIPDLMVKFDRQELIAILGGMGIKGGDHVELTVIGNLIAGRTFAGSDLIGIVETGDGQEGDVVGLPNGKRRASLEVVPFGNAFRLSYTLATGGYARLDIHDVNGRLIRTLVDAQQTSDRHAVTWSGTDASGRKLPRGAYFATMRVGEFTATRKMVKSE